MKIRLDKYLCDMQVGSRSQVKDAIKKGKVLLNQNVCKANDTKIDPAIDLVFYDGKELVYQTLYYYMLHKPAGLVTATTDKKEPTVMDALRDLPGKNLAPVGRLDKDTEGLLLLTNDGEMAHALLAPKKHIPKTYYVLLEKSLQDVDIRRLEEGIDIGDAKPCLPAKVKAIGALEIELTICEGRFHQVKRMMEKVDNKVCYLKRISFGPLVLDEKLEKGSYRPLTEKEIEALKNRA